MKLVNLQRYVPDKYFAGEGFQYFKDATGKDWYKALPGFTKKYSLAIENETGIIRSISEDASRLYPVGLTVVDVDSLPDGCDIFGGWVFNGKKVVPRIYSQDELSAQAQQAKSRLLEAATKAISPLQDAKDLDIATDAELGKLKEWMVYRVKVNRVDTSKAPDITWPTQPE
ncbi:TPA: tail fiber assembly protein [Serratia marcescens]|uniref:tail fiber assembly protein n=1 Tax=Serratia marcescens TaxID=615 RepID=UPI001C40E488|nr:tail fiber assembly protein [Serratia marcescens]EGT0502875.1 tail fiber assembly protein [Serratia marcescens]MDP8630517.1 tail fiber assembly protein [Serratia marcescens]MDP8749349.1 tail fiber assembly protein [Serratia marcescens]MDP8763656.1 tail fiber assembly protein [Serratia marcescens]HBH7056209.1 tail fiber assembly protein [Serratia marcescens]